MPERPAPTDRRTALKERHREAIVAAAAALMDEGGVQFTVDDLAARADVSRRTVFNHFASIDDIVTEVCTDVLGVVVERFVSGASAGNGAEVRSAMFDEIAHALRSTDLVTPMAWLVRALGGLDPMSPWSATLSLRVLDELSARLSAAMAVRHPDADELDVHLLVTSLTSGLVVLNRHWIAATGGADDEPSRQVWAGLVDRMIAAVGTGYGAGAARPVAR